MTDYEHANRIHQLMSENPKTTANDIYKQLGVTPQRQKRMVSEGLIPKPHTLTKADHFKKGRKNGGWVSGMDGLGGNK